MNRSTRLYRATEMQRADRLAAEAGVPTAQLMEEAGRAVADSVRRNFPETGPILLLCGRGNNGGDGYVAARHLLEGGCEVEVLELPGERHGDAAAARQALVEIGRVRTLAPDSLLFSVDRCGLIVDALFGSGLSRPLEGDVARAVEIVNDAGKPVLAVDLPSGLSSDSAMPPGAHVVATLTVQLAGAKLSSAFEPARTAYGEQEVANIGIPAAILARVSDVRLLGSDAGRGVPGRSRGAHKYQVGTVLVLAGSPDYLGAAELACRGAYRAGAGLVTLAAEARLPSSWPEIIFSALSWDEAPRRRLAEIGERRAQAVVAGPGLDARALEHLPGLLAERSVPWVLDAGALRSSEGLRQAVREHGSCVLTPHAGEAARLLDSGAQEVGRDPVAAACEIASGWNATCVLKGVGTVIATPGSRPGPASRPRAIAVSVEGHEGMATGGTGDVLAGVIGAFLAAPGPEDRSPRVEAAVAVHGLAGRLAGEQLGIGMLAGDLVAKLPLALRLLTQSHS